MEYDRQKVDEMVLALLYLTSFPDEFVTRAWKNMDWDAMDRLFEQGLIDDPKSKAKSIVLTKKGEKLSEELFIKHFGTGESTG